MIESGVDKTVKVNGIDIHYIEWGERKGTPLVLIHGYLDVARSWEPFARLLDAGRWIVALDLKGHGDSGWIQGGYYHFIDYVWDFAEFVRHLESDRILLMGHSMGSGIASVYAGTYPSSIAALMLIEGLGPPPSVVNSEPERVALWIESVRERRERKKVREFKTVEEASERLCQSNPRLDKSLALYLATHATRRTQSGRYVWKFDPLLRTWDPFPFKLEYSRLFWSRVESPTLIVKGGLSVIIPGDWEERVKIFKRAVVREVLEAGHMVHHERPGELAGIVSEFLGLNGF